MGRLQKKKTPAERKKTVERAAAREARSDSGGVKKSVLSAPSSKDIRRVGTASRARTPAARKGAVGVQQKNVVEKSIQFLREVVVELKKVTWPTRKQAVGSTVVVLILVVIISLFLGVVDMGLSSLIKVVLN